MSDPMTAPDPKTVREIARDALVIAIRRGATEAVEAALIAHGGAGPVLGEKFDAYTNAVAAEYDRMAAALARPDEQQPADVVTAEQQQDGAVGRVEAWLDNRIHSTFYGPVAPETICSYPVDGDDCSIVYVLTESDLRAVLAERDQLRQLLGIGVDREQWDAIAEAEGCRYEGEQTNDTLVGYLAYQRESSRALSSFLQREVKELEAERTALAARVAELESERDDDLCILAAFLLPNRRPIEEWLCILANHFEARTNALMRDADRFAAARFRVDRVPTATETEES